MKKTCNGCRALEFGIINKYCWECSLGYNIDFEKAVPKEKCPKPKTISDLIYYKRIS